MNLGTATAARGGAEELEDAGDMNVAPHLQGLVRRARNHARQPGCSSQVRPGGGGVALQPGQTVSPEAEADGMGRTPLSSPAPLARPKLAESRISALTRRSTAPKGSCGTCADAEPMTPEQLRMYPGWTHICGVRGCGVTGLDGCARCKAGMRPDVAGDEDIAEADVKRLRLLFNGLCPECGKPCGNDGLMVMHYRWKHNNGSKITAKSIREVVMLRNIVLERKEVK